jgi:hypothetical protein
VVNRGDDPDPVGLTVGTLRWAIRTAIPHEKIEIAANVNITLTQGELPVNTPDLTIKAQSPNQGLITISGNFTSRVFEVGFLDNLTLENLDIQAGIGVANPSVATSLDGFGGAILNFGTVDLKQCNVDGNSAVAGGAIANMNSGTLFVRHSSLFLNDALGSPPGGFPAGGRGGAIVNFGTLIIHNSTIANNTAFGVLIPDPFITIRPMFLSIGGIGGGIANFGTQADLTNVIVAGNSATEAGFPGPFTILLRHSSGGGIYNEGSMTYDGGAIASNSAVLGGGIFNGLGGMVTVGVTAVVVLDVNTAASGGAIYNDAGGKVTVNFSDFFTNTAGLGGAIYNASSFTDVSVGGSTFLGNTPDNITGVIQDPMTGRFYTDQGGNTGLP